MQRLTSKQVADYNEFGYLIVPDLISTEALAGYEARFVDIALGKVLCEPPMNVMRDVMVVKGAVEPETPLHAVNKLTNFEDDPVMFGYTNEPGLLAVIRDLIGQDVYSISTNLFNKPPGVDGRHPLHQDLRYFRIRPADKIVAAWTALGPTTRESGCLTAIPGSHKGQLLEHSDPDWEFVNAGFYGIDPPENAQRVYIELQPGETVFFHPLLIHGSGRNRSDHFRRALSSHYASADCHQSERDWRVGKQARQIS